MEGKPALTQQNAPYYLLNRSKEHLERMAKSEVYKNEFWDIFQKGSFGEYEFKDVVAHYYGCVSFVDSQIGVMLDAVDRLGLSDDTIVIYTSDHGDNTGSHGTIFKNHTFYDELFNVPFLARYPGCIRPGRFSNALINGADLMPTLLEMAGAPIPRDIHGRSFKQALQGQKALHRRTSLSYIMNFSPNNTLQMRMVRSGDWKYCLNMVPQQVDELYDLKNDPGELNNLADKTECAETLQEMKAIMFAEMEAVNDPWLEDARRAKLDSQETLAIDSVSDKE